MGKSDSGQVSREEIRQVLEAVQKEVRRRPPVIGLVGVSGVGKSSTINTLFKTSLATSDTVACTKEFSVHEVEASISKGDHAKKAILRVVDAPGLGEDIRQDPEYLSMYKEHLPDCDVILWVLAARNRAIALDQHYLKQLREFHGKIVFGINQVDLIEPLDWDSSINLPSTKQKENIEIIARDRAGRLSSVLERQVKVIPYSAKARYNLAVIFSELLASCSPERSWIFDAMKGFRYDDFVPENLRSLVAKRLAEGARNEDEQQKEPIPKNAAPGHVPVFEQPLGGQFSERPLDGSRQQLEGQPEPRIARLLSAFLSFLSSIFKNERTGWR